MSGANKITFILFIFFLLVACSPVKYVGENEYLLKSIKIEKDNSDISHSELKRCLRQKPNTRILLFFRLHLGLYNLSGKDESKRINQWLRRIGEPPVVYNPMLARQSTDRLEAYLREKGYYHAVVTDTVQFRRQRAKLIYTMESGPPTRVNKISFKNRNPENVNRSAAASGLLDFYLKDTVATQLHVGMPLDMDLLDAERERITQSLREKGYFNFSKNFIQFFADSSSYNGNKMADLFVRIIENETDSTVYQAYHIRDIVIDLDYDLLASAGGADTTLLRADYDEYTVTYRDRLKIKPKVIIETIQIRKGERYNIRQVAETYSRLQALNLFRFINIEFKEDEVEGKKVLDCMIRLTPQKRQSYNISVEGTNTSGNLGVGGNFTYSHRNLFKGAENFSVSVWGAVKKEQLEARGKIFNTTEYGIEMKLETPQFWLPFIKMKNFRRDFAPRTALSISYSRENTPYYDRSVANGRFGYNWRKSNKKWRYNLDVLDMNYVWMKEVDQTFLDSIKNDYIKSAYTDHMIFSAAFSAVYSDQFLKQQEDNSHFFRATLKSSGNLFWFIDRTTGRDRKEGNQGYLHYTWFDVQYAQFLKGDLEYRYSWHINRVNSMAFRFVVGCGYPYGNMKVLPTEEAFYCGGANDLRAWQARTLGPGSFYSDALYPNSTGDFKLAANLEYRFKLVWLLEGALFVDAGNIWNITRKEHREGTRLTSDFYKQIALGTGTGLRINANYFLLRFDWGLKVKDPSFPEGNRFVLFNRHGGFRNSVFNVAIGYPF